MFPRSFSHIRRLCPKFHRQPPRRPTHPLLFFTSLSAATVPLGYLILSNTDTLPSPSTPHKQPFNALVRSYIVYSLCSIPLLVDYSPKILDAAAKIPVLREIVYALVRVTFFDQFVGGETASAAVPLLRALRAANKGALFAYSVEVDKNEALDSSPHSGSSVSPVAADLRPHKRIVNEILSCIEVAADFEDSLRGAKDALPPYHSPGMNLTSFNPITLDNGPSTSLYAPGHLSPVTENGEGRRTWIAIKVTALLPNAGALSNFSKYLTEDRERMRRWQQPIHEHQGLLQPLELNSDKAAIFQSRVTSVADIPFPGSPLSGDLDVILSPSSSLATLDDHGHNQSIETFPPTPLTREDIHELRELYHDLVKICTHAQNRGVKVIVDAEYSWYQPALDALTLSLMQRFNALPPHPTTTPAATSSSSATNRSHIPEVQPLVYATYQAYLRRTPLHLAHSLQHAKENEYALGVKLVRGAYHPYELDAHYAGKDNNGNTAKGLGLSISPDLDPPVWLEKKETDEAYDASVRMLIGAIADDIRGGTSDNANPLDFGDAGSVPPKLTATWPWTSVFRSGWNVSRMAAAKEVSPHSSHTPFNGALSHANRPRVALGVLFGTHNWDSCNLILSELAKNGLGEMIPSTGEGGEARVKLRLHDDVVERVAVGQLYGMCDDLTDMLVSRTLSRTPLVIKYVPYGGLKEVLPYLSRRAIENRSVLGQGGASRERHRAGTEIWRRVVG